MIKRIALFSLLAIFASTSVSQAYYKGSHENKEAKEENHSGPDYNTGPLTMSDLESNFVKTALPYPTGIKSTSSILLEKHFPQKGIVGKPYPYMIKVINLSDIPLENVKVSEVIPENFKITSSEPEVSSKIGTKATWTIGALEANGHVLIKVTGEAADKASSPCCTKVDYDVPALCHKTILEQPAVKLELKAPSENLACDLVELQYTVKNTGDSLLEDLSVTSKLPEGVTSSQGSSTVEFTVASLEAGESTEVKQLVSAPEIGSYRFSGKVDGEHVSDNSNVRYTKVVKPKVSVNVKSSREKQYIGRDIKYIIEVKNLSGVEAQSTMVVAEIPENTDFKSASDDGHQVEDIVGWEVGTLKGYETKKLNLILTANDQGNAKTKVGVQASCCEPTTDTAETQMVGIPALLLEVVDMIDPIEIGEEETYMVKVTNQGTADAHNVSIAASFDGMEFIEIDGETDGTFEFNKLKFGAVEAIGSKESVTWKVKVKGSREGDLRFKVSLTSDELTQPVEEAESTFVY